MPANINQLHPAVINVVIHSGEQYYHCNKKKIQHLLKIYTVSKYIMFFIIEVGQWGRQTFITVCYRPCQIPSCKHNLISILDVMLKVLIRWIMALQYALQRKKGSLSSLRLIYALCCLVVVSDPS